jgi:hypothetical protein
MDIFLRVLCCLFLAFQANAVSGATLQQGGPAASKPSVLEDGTPVRLRFSQTVSSEDAHVNDRVEFEVLEEIKVADTVVIPKGGIAWGTVTEAKPKRRMARGGKLEIVMDSVRLVDGEKAALRATKEAKGGGHTGAMTAGIVVTGLIIWPAAPFFLFMHGKEISIPKGTEVPTFINGNFPLELAKFQQGTPSATPGLQATAQPSNAPTAAASLTGTNAELEITSTPSGAEVQLDGNFVGSTPSTIGVSAGDHVITINKNGYRPWERKLKTSTRKVNLVADLEPDIKGEPKTAAPAPVQASATSVAVRETAPAPPSEIIPGKIFITSSPVGAEIYADSLFVGRTPSTMKLKPGQHSIVLLMKDYKNWSQTITAEAGSELQLTATLEKSN